MTTFEHWLTSLFPLTGPGQKMFGSCTSTTVTVKEQVAEFPPPSVTLKIFVVTPTGNKDPLANPAVLVVVAPVQLSVPAGVVYVRSALQTLLELLAVILAGQVIEGAMPSVLLTVNEHVPVLEMASVAVRVTVTDPVPVCAVPLRGDWVKVGVPPQLSLTPLAMPV